MKRILLLPVILTLPVLPGLVSAYNHPELSWRVIETEHFRILYHQGEEEIARQSARVAEEIYPGITQYYEFEPSGKTLIIFTDTDDFANGESSYFRNLIRITASSLDMPLRGRSDWLENVITHEYTHIVSLQRADTFGRHLPILILSALENGSSRGRPRAFQLLDVAWTFPLPGSITPRWFSESTAQIGATTCGSDSWDTHRDMFLRACWKDEKLLPLDEMGTLWGKGAWEAELVYNQGFALGIYLKDRYGEDVLKRLIHEQGRGWHWDFRNTIEEVTGEESGDVFRGWRDCLEKRYREQLEGIEENEIKGEEFSGRGKLNLSPRYSPDGEWIAYLSSGGSDYLATSLLIAPREWGGDPLHVRGGVSAGAAFAPDGRSLIYSRRELSTLRGNHFSDLYLYDLEEKKEYQLTRGLRASEPDWSPSGINIAFVRNAGGTKNIWIMDLEKEEDELQELTAFPPGTQVYSPVFSPSGERIAFGILNEGSEDIWAVDLKGTVVPLLTGPENERDPAWVDEDTILFSSDEGGIFNLYSFNTPTGMRETVTRLATGAFQPAVDPQGEKIAYSYFSSEGYRIYALDTPGVSSREENEAAAEEETGTGFPDSGEDGQAPGVHLLASDASLSGGEDRSYRFSLLPVSVFPELVYEDEQGFKGGAALMLSEALGKHSLLAECLFGDGQDYAVQYINRQLDVTLFFEGRAYNDFSYRGNGRPPFSSLPNTGRRSTTPSSPGKGRHRGSRC